MLDLTQVGPGSHVLDVAAGAGGQTLAAARRAGADGAVLATDIPPAILEHAAAEAGEPALRTWPPKRWTASTSTFNVSRSTRLSHDSA